MKLLVCGSRYCQDQDGVFKQLDKLHAETKIELVIHGAARGVDTIAGLWADVRGIPCIAMPAPWHSSLGDAAGPVRNGWMLKWGRPDMVFAFQGGTGTANMVAQAKKAGVAVRKVGQE